MTKKKVLPAVTAAAIAVAASVVLPMGVAHASETTECAPTSWVENGAVHTDENCDGFADHGVSENAVMVPPPPAAVWEEDGAVHTDEDGDGFADHGVSENAVIVPPPAAAVWEEEGVTYTDENGDGFPEHAVTTNPVVVAPPAAPAVDTEASPSPQVKDPKVADAPALEKATTSVAASPSQPVVEVPAVQTGERKAWREGSTIKVDEVGDGQTIHVYDAASVTWWMANDELHGYYDLNGDGWADTLINHFPNSVTWVEGEFTYTDLDGDGGAEQQRLTSTIPTIPGFPDALWWEDGGFVFIDLDRDGRAEQQVVAGGPHDPEPHLKGLRSHDPEEAAVETDTTVADADTAPVAAEPQAPVTGDVATPVVKADENTVTAAKQEAVTSTAAVAGTTSVTATPDLYRGTAEVGSALAITDASEEHTVPLWFGGVLLIMLGGALIALKKTRII